MSKIVMIPVKLFFIVIFWIPVGLIVLAALFS